MQLRDMRVHDLYAGVVEIEVPRGAPCWITADLLEDTLAVWQPRYLTILTFDDALEMLLNIGRLANAMGLTCRKSS